MVSPDPGIYGKPKPRFDGPAKFSYTPHLHIKLKESDLPDNDVIRIASVVPNAGLRIGYHKGAGRTDLAILLEAAPSRSAATAAVD